MSTKEDYQEKIEAEVELALAKLAELKAQARTSTADARIKYSKQIDTLEQEVVSIRSKVKEMAAAGEDSWEQLKYGVVRCGAWVECTEHCYSGYLRQI